MSASLTIDNNTPTIGNSVFISVLITSLNQKGLSNVSAKIACPQHSQFQNSLAYVGSYSSTTLNWDVGNVSAFGQAKLIIECEILTSGLNQTVTSSVTNIRSSSNRLSNLSKTISIQNNQADLSTTITTDSLGAVQSQKILYTINVLNNGPNLADDPQLTFKCPDGTNLLSNTPDTNSTYYTLTGLWTLPDLEINESKNLVLECKVVASSGTITASTSAASSNGSDPSSTGDSLSFLTNVVSSCTGTYTSTTPYQAYGDGSTEATAYEIGHPAQLIDLRDNGVDDWDKKFQFCNDLDMSLLGEEITLGTDSQTFNGSIYGNGNKILNFNFSKPLIHYASGDMVIKDIDIESSNANCASEYCGFLIANFSYGTKLVVENISISADSSITTTHPYAASVLGYGNNTPTFQMNNITNNADIVSTSYAGAASANAYASGVVGRLKSAGGSFTNITNTGSVTTDGRFVGGVFSWVVATNTMSINAITNSGDIIRTVSGTNGYYIGGVFGILDVAIGAGEVLVSNITNSGDVSALTTRSFYIGGVAGYINGQNATDKLSMSNIHTLAGVTISCTTSPVCQHVGGLFGMLSGSFNDASTLSTSSSRADVFGNSYTGGFAGSIYHNWSVTDSDSYGDVSGGAYTGGFVGYMPHYVQITNSNFHGSNVTGTSVTGGFVGYMADCPGCIGTASIDNSHVISASVTSTGSTVGGFVGYAYENSSITNSSTTLTSITGGNNTNHGGFAGYVHGRSSGGATFTNDHVYAAGVTLSSTHANPSSIGGFIGGATEGVLNVSNCSTNIDVDAFSNSGGFIGILNSAVSQAPSRSLILDSTSSGNVNCRGDYCGGFAGQMTYYTSVDNGTSLGDVTSPASAKGVADYHGGFIGLLNQTGLIKNSKALGDVIGYADYASGFAAYLNGESDILDSYVDNNSIKGTQYNSGFIGYLNCEQPTINSIDQKCEVKRNYVKTGTIEDIYDGTDAVSPVAAGFIGNMRTGSREVGLEIEDNFTDFSFIKTKNISGGFIATFQPNAPNIAVVQTISIRRNFVKGGTIQAYPSISTKHIGGFMGQMYNDSYISRGTTYIEDNYTNASIDLSLMTSSAGGYVGSFQGFQNAYDNTYIKRNYTTTSSIDGNSIASYIGGFVGGENTDSNGSTEPSYEDNFTTTANLSNAVSGTDLFLGRVLGPNPSMSNNYYNSSISCTGSLCNATNGGSGATNASFQGSTSNPPLNNWNFTTTWEARAGKYPKLRCPALASAALCTEWDNAQP